MIRGVEEIVAVAETGSFTAAAERLNTTVASVSRRVGELEERLGVKLFVRSTRKVQVSPDGENYIAQCQDALRLLKSAESEIVEHQSSIAGHIRLTAAIEFGERVVAPAVAKFQLAHPEISIEIVLSNDRFDLIDGRYDLAVRVGDITDASLIVQKVFERKLITCAAPGYINTHGKPETVSALQKHNCLRGSSSSWRFQERGKVLRKQISGGTACNSGTALTDMALRGLGIAQLPDYYVNSYLEAGQLTSVLDKYQAEPESIWIVRPDKRFTPLRVKAFIEFLIQDIRSAKR